MTKVPQGFDFSFLNEEARKVLQVLERNEELQRAEKDRISKLQKTKRDIRWLQGVTGEWFEEVQRKKFCSEADVSQMLKQPFTYRLRKGMAENDPMELQTSRSKNIPNQRNPTSVASRLSFRSSFASLFSFRKSRKETLKLQPLGQKGCDDHIPPVSVRGTALAKIYNSPLENQPIDSAFVPKPAGMREGSSMPPWDASLLEDEFFQVLDDLDGKLAQEESPSSLNARTPLNYGSRTEFSRFYSSGNKHRSITARHKNCCNETSNMSIYDILRPGTPKEGFKTFSPRTRTICDMYKTREPRVLKEDYAQKNIFGSISLYSDSRQRSASPATGYFTARNLPFSATTQNKTGFIPPSHQQSPKRTPLSSIIWNRSDSSRDRQNQEEFLRAPSPMEIDLADQNMYPRCFQEDRRYEFYHSQSVHQSVGLNASMNNAMSPDPFENSENMPFYHEENPFTRSFLSNTFGWSREQRFGQSPFWGQQEEHSSWSDFHQSRKPFTSSDRNFEMTSIEANSAFLAGHCHSVPSQHWGSFSLRYRTNISRNQEKPHPSQFDSQASTLESMEVSQVNRNQSTHFSTPNVCPMSGSSYHIKSGGLECQQDSSPMELHINKEPYSFGIAQTLASSFKTTFPQIPDDRRNPQSPNFQNPTVTSQKIKPASLPIRNYTEVTGTDSDSVDSPPLTESQPNILVTEVNNEKDLNGSVLEKDKQLNKIDQTNLTGEIPQLVSQTVISNPLPDFQNLLSQDSAKSNRFVFNASTTISSKSLPGVISRRDISKIHKANELKKDKSYTGNRKLGSATSLPFIQESRTTSPFLSPNQGCHQDLTVRNTDISSIIKNNHGSPERTDNQNAQSPEKPAVLDTKEEQCTTTYSTNCSKSPADHNMPCDSLDLSSGTLPDSSPSNDSFLDALVIPSTTGFSWKCPSSKDLSLGEREEKDNDYKNQNSQFSLSLSENQKSNVNFMPVHNEVVDVVKCHSYPPFRDGKGKGKIRRRISYTEKLSKMESRSIPTSDSRNLTEGTESNSKPPELHTIYCTLPRKSANFLINNRKSESKIMPSSFRNEPLAFQIKNDVEDPVGKYISNKFSPSSCESESKCSGVVSDSVSVPPEATEGMTNMTNIGSASGRKGPLQVLIKRAVSCPSGVPYASTGRDEREKGLVSDTDASTITLKPWERLINPLGSDSSVRECSLSKQHHQKEYFQECTEKNGRISASRTGIFSHSNEHPLPFSADLSGKESGKTLHKFKTTSMFSVSGDEDNVKCLEVISIYYTLTRKHRKKFCNLLQKYTQNIDSLTESAKVGTKTSPNALEKDKLNCSTQEQSGTPSSKDLKMQVSSAQENSHLSHTTENMTGLQLLSFGSSEPALQEIASIEADVSLHKGEPKSREISPHNLAKTPLCDSQSKKEKGKKLRSETVYTSPRLQGKKGTREKSENCQQSIKSGNSDFSNLPAHSEENVENSQIIRSSGECTSSAIAITATGSLQKDITGIAIGDSSDGLQPGEVRGEIRKDFPKNPDKPLSDSESQVFALTPALHKLQLDEKTCSSEQDLDSLQSEPREPPQRSQEVNMTESKAKDEMQELAWNQPSLPEGSNKSKKSLDDLEKGKNRSSVKHRLAVMSKACRKFPAEDLYPRRHVATIFPQSGNSSGFSTLSLGTPECNPHSPVPTLKSTESTDESRLSNDGVNVEKPEDPLQVTAITNRETYTHSSNQKSNNISQPHQNEFKKISESQLKYENSKDVTVAQILGGASEALAQPSLISLREADFPDHQRGLNPPLQLEPAEKSTVSMPLASFQQQQRSASSLEWEPEPHPCRSKSLKSINVHGALLRKSHPPKVRERHFSESTSIDNSLSQLTLGNEFSNNSVYSRRFKSFSELPSCDENESWALYNSRPKMGPRSATSISRPIDYGIFGKEQQLAFLENVKRSLTQGRLWKPSFLKNPGFLKDDVVNPPNLTESSSSNSPSNQMPEDGLSLSTPLNIYEDDPVDSDCDTDTTTDDEYYLDENDKESEL
ncbi:exophilin-5 isoform X2 [Physeter macrocephalus]|uniref:Exophilin-5 isoform X2 n=1 Tax=Physeter macrocephalus TaxID=9755 RepID=A0A2Y9FEL6_PHYMC|nr:exophilin-5 isoform X2 [Physeter catodon]